LGWNQNNILVAMAARPSRFLRAPDCPHPYGIILGLADTPANCIGNDQAFVCGGGVPHLLSCSGQRGKKRPADD
jgi:hypothetical protein